MPPPRGTPGNFLEGPGDYDVTEHVHNSSYPAISPLSCPASGKSVFVTGASRGLGRALAIAFAQSGAAQIAIGARSELSSTKEAILAAASEAGRAEPKVLCIRLDTSSQSSTEAAAALVEQEFGMLDIVVNNAAIIGEMKKIIDSDPKEWWETWNVNVNGPYLVSRAFLPLLLKKGDKTIVATSSVGAHLVESNMSAYQPSKLAVTRLMQFVAKEHKEDGLVAFSVHPGNSPTDMVGGKNLREDLKPLFTETPDLSADTIAFLTREKREWLSGRYINCTWDMPELLAKKDLIVKGDKLKVKLDWAL